MAENVVPITKKIIAFGSKYVFLYASLPVAHQSGTEYAHKAQVHNRPRPRAEALPYHALFKVPLNFSKYDLRDYIYHAYDIKTFSIRSRIKLMPVRDAEDIPKHLFRETIEKYMTVEMGGW